LILQVIMSGIAIGAIYALLALGIVLIFKTTLVLNFAHGEVAMLTTLFAYSIIVSLGFPYWVGVIGALVLGGILGILSDLLVRPLLNAPLLSMVGLTIAMFFVIHAIGGIFWGYQTWPFPNPFPEKAVDLGGLVVSPIHLFIIFVLLVLGGVLFAVLNFTTVGTAFRATCQDRRAALLMGISSNRVFAISWAAGCALGAISGILIAPIIHVQVNMMVVILLKAFAAAVLGGILSLPGAIVGGVVLGVVENIFSFYCGTEFQDSIAFLIIILVLLVRPQGILGSPVEIKV